MPPCRAALKDKPPSGGALNSASLTAARHDGKRSANRIKPPSDPSTVQNNPLRMSRSLEAAAVHIEAVAKPSGLSVSDIQQAFATESVLPRPLTTRELDLIEQSKEDFRRGRTRTLSESMSYVDAELDRRRRLRSAG